MRIKILAIIGAIGIVMGIAASRLPAGEITVEGSLTVKTNLTVHGQVQGATLSLTNLAIAGQATIQSATIRELVPQGDLSMGPYTNRVAQ